MQRTIRFAATAAALSSSIWAYQRFAKPQKEKLPLDVGECEKVIRKEERSVDLAQFRRGSCDVNFLASNSPIEDFWFVDTDGSRLLLGFCGFWR